MGYIQKLRSLLNRKTELNLLWLVVFSVFVSVVEAVGISAIMPFIDVATNFETIQTNQYYQWAFNFFGFEKEIDFVIAFGLVLIGFYIFRGGVNWLYSYIMTCFSENLYAQTTKKLFKAYLAMPYQVFVNKNSSYLTKTIITEVSLISMVVRAVLLIISETFVIVFLYILMMFVSWKVTLIFTVILVVKMLFLTQVISKKIKGIGVIRAKVQANFYEIINRVLSNFKHVKLQDKGRLQDTENDFSEMVDRYAKANASYNFLNEFPRFFLETSGFVLIILLLVVLLYLNQSNVSYILPTLSLFVLALYRLLPSINRIVRDFNLLVYHHKSIDIVYDGLKTNQEKLKDEIVKFNHNIKLMNVDFCHQEKTILSDITLTINKGEKVAFIGESGSGKSTLVDLIIGLYQPNQGKMKVDNVTIDEFNLQNWRSQIGYIPQQVYLFDGTIAENVCFGRKFNQALLERVLKQANIFVFLQTKQGINTLVGEGGIQLSGGQRQRAAIARALYGEPEILVLDEATSALDEETEKSIMNEIYKASKEKTLIVIAHRLSTIKGCNKIYEIKDGKIS
jgi:ATP-binding cassette subfamily B protein